MTDKTTIEYAMKRRAGMDEGRKRALVNGFQNADDLYTTCQQCGSVVKGTMQELKNHAESCTGAS